LEERFKEKNKQNKELLKERTLLEGFFSTIFPKDIADRLYPDKESKALAADLQVLLKEHSEIYEVKKGEQGRDDVDEEMSGFIKEENANLKAIVQEMNA
jgi:hypothetical protein